jgi:class 3 adenylate cyclase
LIALDIVLPDRSYDAIRPGLDAALVEGLSVAKRAAPLVVGLALDTGGTPRPVDPLLLATLGESSLGLAYALADADGTARRFAPGLAASRLGLPGLAERVVEALGGLPRSGLIDFACGEPFDYVPMGAVLGWSAEPGLESARAAFSGKVVLVGSVLPDTDRIRQPLSLAAWEPGSPAPPGVVLQAQTVRALRSDCLLAELGAGPLAAFAAAGALVFLVPGAIRVWVAALGAVGGILVLTGYGYLNGVFAPPAAPIAAVMLAAAARSVRDARTQRRERLAIERRFAGYVSPNLLDRIKGGMIDIERPRKHAELAFLFADIRGFTTMSERLPAEQVVALLNRYYEAMAPAIHDFEGTIDNFRGDGIMVAFGVFDGAGNPARNAFAAAREMFRRLRALNELLERDGQPRLAIGIGIASGEAIVGNIGSADRHDFTAIGDAVNVAARLQSLCKPLGMRLIVSDAAARQLDEDPGLQSLGMLELAGHTPVAACGWPADRES